MIVPVTFGWSDEHGPCYDCGLPAAFHANYYERADKGAALAGPYDPLARLCSVCAANAAVDGYTITRIDNQEVSP